MSSHVPTSLFLRILRENGSLPLVFRAPGKLIPSGYHLTEVKRVSYETMDCGAMVHRWSETQFELWVPPLNPLLPGRGHMPAEKFLRIVDRVEQELPLNGASVARIFASFDGQPAALYDITAVTPHDGQLWVELAPDRTRCKAAERRVAGLAGGCCSTSGASSATEETACCSAEPTAQPLRKSDCCAG